MTQPIHPMLERVATGICHELNKEGQYIPDWLRLAIARAAIQALLEPDEGMVEAGEDAMIYTDGDFIRNQAETVYQAMLKPLLGDEG